MKKAMLTFLVLMLAFTLSLSSAALAETAEPPLGDYMNGKVINLRFLRTGEEMDQVMKGYFDEMLGVTTEEFHLTDAGIDTLLLSLQSGKIDGLMTWSFEADYFAQINPNFLAVETGYQTYLTASMLVSTELENAEELTAMLDATIADMWADGTLEQLQDKYVTNITAETQAESIEIPHTDGAPTYRVVVSGWAVPLDYFDAAGNPTGFDAAMLAEIAKRQNVNFEISLYDPSSGVMAVSTGKADINFCYVAVYDTEEEVDMESGYEYPQFDDAGTLIGTMRSTRPYFRAKEMKLLVAK